MKVILVLSIPLVVDAQDVLCTSSPRLMKENECEMAGSDAMCLTFLIIYSLIAAILVILLITLCISSRRQKLAE